MKWQETKHRIISYLDFIEKKRSHFFIHSPFVFFLSQKILLNKEKIFPSEEVELLRKFLKNNPRAVEYRDFGANAKHKGEKKVLSLGEIFRKMAISSKKGNLLYRLCYFLQPKNLLELGTNIGISTYYQLAALSEPYEFVSVEANASLTAIARQLLHKYPRIRLETALFEEYLDTLSDKKLDYVFLDGNHAYAPTIKYVRKLIPHLGKNAVIILDDIYWSREMTRAWNELITYPEFSLTIDLFDFGLLFFQRNQAKEHFVLTYK